MRVGSAYEAVLAIDEGSDVRGPGGAITMALCGSLDHEPPCPLAPHQTSTSSHGDLTIARIVFASEPGDVAEVRRRIEDALAAGGFVGPDGHPSTWSVVRAGPTELLPDERELAARFAA